MSKVLDSMLDDVVIIHPNEMLRGLEYSISIHGIEFPTEASDLEDAEDLEDALLTRMKTWLRPQLLSFLKNANAIGEKKVEEII